MPLIAPDIYAWRAILFFDTFKHVLLNNLVAFMNKDEWIVSELVKWIDGRIESVLTVDDIAKKSGYSKFFLYRKFYDFTGYQIGSYIKNKKLSRAKYLLLWTDEPVGSIALQLGFSSQQTFTRLFTKKFNIPPGKWRLIFKTDK